MSPPQMSLPPTLCQSLGMALRPDAGGELGRLVICGLRRNPRRAHLLVSTVLGKHLPADPAVVRGAADRLGDLVAAVLRPAAPAGGPAGEACVVFGFAETATGLGHCVAARLGAAVYLQSTRRPGAVVYGDFTEGHSHATSHLLQPSSPTLLAGAGPGRAADVLVLVDDEISTGATALDSIRALHALHPHRRYIVASLVDLRSPDQRARIDRRAAEAGLDVTFVALAHGAIDLPAGLEAAVAELTGDPPNPRAGRRGTVDTLAADWPAEVPDGGRHGVLGTEQEPLAAAAARVAAAIAARLDARRTIVIGHEELMYLPLCVAEALAAAGHEVRFQTTTRSPALIRDEPGYPLRRGFEFASPEPDPHAPLRYLYNADFRSAAGDETPARLVFIADSPADGDRLRGPGGLLDVLTAAGHDVLVVIVPASDQARLAAARAPGSDPPITTPPLRGPEFGSYAPDEVTWLLKDLSAVALEANIADRERRIQAGLAHYAESLPVEYQPSAEYRALFDSALADSAPRLAEAVGTVTELLLTERGRDLTLVSLARAGTPIGILIRRWAARFHGLRLPHYAVSIVRGRGIDRVALEYLATRHDPASVVFVDGWTGKGAITAELAAALDEYAATGGPRLNPEVAVLADPGHCAKTYGTRDDFLIASACLNSTVSGLVSRTVLNADLIGPREFHGAKFYAELAPFDVSGTLLDTVTSVFDGAAAAARGGAAALAAAPAARAPDWSGWASVEAVRARYGISTANLVKPGIGETTRVLLRRVPWRVLLREADDPDHRHIRRLAAERGVPVEVVPDLAYACIGLIKEGPP